MNKDKTYGVWENYLHSEPLQYNCWAISSLNKTQLAQIWKSKNSIYQWVMFISETDSTRYCGDSATFLGAQEEVKKYLDRYGYVSLDPKFLVML